MLHAAGARETRSCLHRRRTGGIDDGASVGVSISRVVADVRCAMLRTRDSQHVPQARFDFEAIPHPAHELSDGQAHHRVPVTRPCAMFQLPGTQRYILPTRSRLPAC